jgi:DNA-binding LacI/PurR family transcriptional regulator
LVTIDKNIGIDGIGSVTSDNRQGISQAIRHLVDYGHRRFAYVGPKYPYYTSETDRYNAFFKEVTEANISLSNLFFIDSKQISSELPELLQKRKFPTAFCCFSDYVSLAVLDVVEKLGLKIPDDLSITGYGNAIPKIEYHRVPLTTVSQSPAIIGKEAAKMILSIIEDRAKPYDLRIPTHLIPRGSTGPVNKAKTDKKNPKGRR